MIQGNVLITVIFCRKPSQADTDGRRHTPQCVEKSLHTVGRLLFKDLDAALHLCGSKDNTGDYKRSAIILPRRLVASGGPNNDTAKYSGGPPVF